MTQAISHHSSTLYGMFLFVRSRSLTLLSLIIMCIHIHCSCMHQFQGLCARAGRIYIQSAYLTRVKQVEGLRHPQIPHVFLLLLIEREIERHIHTSVTGCPDSARGGSCQVSRRTDTSLSSARSSKQQQQQKQLQGFREGSN